MNTSRLAVLVMSLGLSALPVWGQITLRDAPQSAQPAPDLPPGLTAARLLPGWTDGRGNRIMALELLLAPGWKTYWRSPGDTGLPPQFAWEGSRNMAGVTLHWPAPEAIRSGERLEMGYHERLVLPFTAHAADLDSPVSVSAQVDLGLCEKICVPASLDLRAAGPGDLPDAAITAAIAAEPQRLKIRPACRVSEIDDGLRVSIDLPRQNTILAAIELTDRPEVWISAADLVRNATGTHAVVEMVGPSGQPFALDPGDLRLTMVSGDGARAADTLGCDLQG